MKVFSLFAILILIGGFTISAKEINIKALSLSSVTTDTLPVKNDTSYIDENGELKVFEKVDVEAGFPGGLEAWKEFVMNTLNPAVPAEKGAPAGQYTVVVQFIVDKDGSVTAIKALTKHGYGMETEVVRMIKRSPKWTPAQQGGRFVRAYRKQPVTFVVEEEKKKRRSRG